MDGTEIMIHTLTHHPVTDVLSRGCDSVILQVTSIYILPQGYTLSRPGAADYPMRCVLRQYEPYEIQTVWVRILISHLLENRGNTTYMTTTTSDHYT